MQKGALKSEMDLFNPMISKVFLNNRLCAKLNQICTIYTKLQTFFLS